jgi:type IV fimbrial biogenesis protein FimT
MRLRRGFTIIEMMIGIAIMGILLMLALPEFSLFLQNAQIRNASESILQGLNLARSEALRRNAAVRFQLVSDLTSGCALASSSPAWVVSLDDPTAKCDLAPSDTTPKIVQKQSGTEGTGNIVINATGGALVTFNGLGRPTGAATTAIDILNTSGTCEHDGGPMRCMRITISAGGQPRVCDPKVSAAGDPRNCSI